MRVAPSAFVPMSVLESLCATLVYEFGTAEYEPGADDHYLHGHGRPDRAPVLHE